MKRSAYLRFSLTLVLVASMLSPMAVLAVGDGKKYFKTGMKHESAEQWDQAVESFALAVTEDPKNPEYRLHLQRSLFNASQMYMKKGNVAANEKDYESAYTSFRKAYAYDPVNELAKAEMARMVRLQTEAKGGVVEGQADQNGKIKLVPTGYSVATPQDVQVPQRLEKLRSLPFPTGIPLQQIVKDLAKDLELNVLFDTESRLDGRQVKIDIRDVSSAKALDYIFLQENLFFQKVGPRTILVATGNRRTNFQQLVLRTFYLANASPKDVKAIITSAIPAQPGRSQTIVLEDAATNSITIRDTQENIRLIGKLISSLDKDRAEVVMDVAIYEVNKNDLLQLGNQIGNEGSLTSLGGTTRGVVGLGGNDIFGRTAAAAASVIPKAFGVGLVIPAVNLIAFQNKNNTKLIASTQIHAFNNEDSSARIGQRVPVRTASFAPTTGNGNNNNQVFGDVFNYEQVGLTLKFKPIVFPNQDVQVAMEIESKDVAGALTDQPVFTERSIKGTARVQNNKTLLLASVAQNTESNGRQGLPLLGLIPIIGRLFTAPTKDNRQVDIVIAITPRVIRAPSILPEDEIERPTGSLATPTSGSLEAMVIQEDREEFLASARRLPTTATVQLPDQAASPAYVRGAVPQADPVQAPVETQVAITGAGAALNLRPIDSSVKMLAIKQTSDTSMQNAEKPTLVPLPAAVSNPIVDSPIAELQISWNLAAMKRGEKMKIPIMVKSATLFRSAVLGLRFDDKRLAVRSVSFGDIFGPGVANTNADPFLNNNGRMNVSLSLPQGTVGSSSGILAYVEVEALADGAPEITLERDVLNLLAADGRNFAVKF
ncbi:MAG: secretin N-terminal domain-containing protein [Pyrinomonadaceae bacterium]